MDVGSLLADGFGRVREEVGAVLDGIDPAALADRVDGRSNPVGWLVWHLTRVQDDHVADAFGAEQVWTAEGWAERAGLPLPVTDTGYGHGPDEVAAVAGLTSSVLAGYHDAVHAVTLRRVTGLSPAELDRVVDRSWDPPVTLGVRLVSVLGDDLQHVGQAAYVRGLLARRDGGR